MKQKQEAKRFWNFTETDDGETLLRIDGYIAEEPWFGDEVTPKAFKAELDSAKGNITVWINSPGGDCFAASQIYTMLKERDGKVTVCIDGIAASAASVIAMAGDSVKMSPTSLMMVHNPAALIFGEASQLEQGIEMLNEVKESIINAYQLKSGLPRAKISKLMDAETWMNGLKAVELGFADEVLYAGETAKDKATQTPLSFNYAGAAIAVVNAMKKTLKKKEPEKPQGTPITALELRLNNLKKETKFYE